MKMKHWIFNAIVSVMSCSLFLIISNNYSVYAQETDIIGSVPIGTLLPFYGGDSLLPPGYLFCKGDTISRTRYPKLYVHLIMANPSLKVDEENVKLPDLRGEFIRGWDNGRRVDIGRKLGTFQKEEVGKHTHDLTTAPYASWTNTPSSEPSKYGLFQKGHTVPTKPNVGKENRPRNIAVNFIIKY